MPVKITLVAVMASLIGPAKAHGLFLEAAETFTPPVFSGLFLIVLWLTYFLGARRVRPSSWRRLLFHAACLIIATQMLYSLNGPLENCSALHMVQHLLIMAVITPLLVLARPLPQWRAVSGRFGSRLWKPWLRLSRFPLWTAFLQGIVIWLWHAPKFYNLALASPWWHFVEHLSFALSAGLFWWSVLDRRSAAALPALLFTLMHTGMLGALLTFTQFPLYDDLRDLQDQQLAGLIMWAPGGLPYIIAGGWCGLRWFDKSERSIKPNPCTPQSLKNR